MIKQIDPIYKKYTSRVIKYISSMEFYDYFMEMMETGKNTFQFSNRKVEKTVDATWVSAIEAVIQPMEEIIRNPRNFIRRDEVIVNIAVARKVEPDAIRHLAQHGNMIDTITEEGVRPNKIMNKFKEDSWNTYENRFVYTLLEMTWEFVDKRYEAIFSAMGEEYGAFLKMNSDISSYNERVISNMDIKIRQEEDLLSADEKNETIFSRIARLHRLLGNFRQTPFAKEVVKFGKIKPPLVKTNAIAKNPNFKACHKLWNFILAYKDVGYNIKIYEQNPDIDESFTQDIYHSILFNYIILKNYLEDPSDREIDLSKKIKKKALKPKFITEVIEEIVKNYDLPDVEIKKVLIEEVTKAQLMKEEEKERMRLVEEKEKEMLEQKKAKEREEARLAKEAEKERIRKEKEELRERMRKEKEREEALLREQKEKERKEQADMQKGTAFVQELEDMVAFRQEMLDKRKKDALSEELRIKALKEKEVQEAQKAKAQEEKRIKLEKEKTEKQKQAQIEKEKLAKERAKAKEKADAARAREKEKEKEKAQREKERIKEKERLAIQKEKEKERLAKEKEKEKLRLAKEKEKEKLRLAKEKEANKKKPTKKSTKAEKKVEEVAPIVEEKVEEVAPIVEEKVEEVTPIVEEKVEEVATIVEEKVEEVTPIVEEKVEEVAPVVEQKVEEVAPVVEEKTQEVAPIVEEKVEEVTPIVEEKVEDKSSEKKGVFGRLSKLFGRKNG